MPNEIPTWENSTPVPSTSVDVEPTWENSKDISDVPEWNQSHRLTELTESEVRRKLGLTGFTSESMTGPEPEQFSRPALTLSNRAKDIIGLVATGWNTPKDIQAGVGEMLGGLAESMTSPEGAGTLAAAVVSPAQVLPELLIGGYKRGSERFFESLSKGDRKGAASGITEMILSAAPVAHVAARPIVRDIGIARTEAATREAMDMAEQLKSADIAARNLAKPSIAEVGPRALTPNEIRDVGPLADVPVDMVRLNPNLPYTAAMPKEFFPEVQAGVKEAFNRLILKQQREAELGAGGLLEESGQIFRSTAETPGFERTAEQKISQRPIPSEPTEIVEAAAPSGELKTVEDLVRAKLDQRDWAGVVSELGDMPAEAGRALVDKLTGVGEKSVPISAGERTIFNAIWEQTLDKFGIKQAAPAPVDIITRLESKKFGAEETLGGAGANPFPQIGKAVWNTAIDLIIAAIKAGRTIESGLSEALSHIRKNAKDYDEAAVTAYLKDIASKETAPSEATTPPPIPSGPPPVPKDVTLDDVYARFVPEKEPNKGIVQGIKDTGEAFRTGFSSRFRPLEKLAEDIAKSYGKKSMKDIRGAAELLKGSTGKAEMDIRRFDRDVTKLVGKSEADFDAYLFLKRSLDRLRQDQADIARAMAGEDVKTLNRRQVGDYTIEELEPKLAKLESDLGPKTVSRFEKAADLYQKHLDDALFQQVESGRMSPDVYQDIKAGNQFYAPFKLQKFLEDGVRPAGTGRQIDTMADYTKAMTGITDKNFKLAHMLPTARMNIALSRILSEKNRVMNKFAEVAREDTAGLFVKELGPQEKVPKDMEAVNVIEGGKETRFAVDKGISEAVKMMDDGTSDAVTKFLSYSAIPFKAGATALNVAFQPVNLFLADTPRQALVSKYGIKGASDIVRYPMDWVHSLLFTMGARIFKFDNKLYADFLDSGAAGAVFQDWLNPRTLKELTTQPHFARSILRSIPEFGRAIEETNKALGVKRAIREHRVSSGKELAEKFPEAVTEIRRFSGSPDFGVIGKWTDQYRLNILFPFSNARMQGGISTIGRLTGADGAKTAAKTWGKLAGAFSFPTIGLWFLNNLPQYKADYDSRPKWEKDNYFLIPKDSYIKDNDGNKIRDYWRIPKRDVVQLFANTTEAALNFASAREPNELWAFGASVLENISPVNIAGEDAGERAESVASGLHPILKQFYTAASGRDPFRHRDIIGDRLKKVSPERQFTDRTPELFKTLANVMPDIAPEVLRSPLVLENIVENFTAGLITQFLPLKEPAGGRTGIEANRFLKRFQAAPYTENAKTKEEIAEYQRQAANEWIDRDRISQESIKNNPPLDDAVKASIEKGGNDPLLIQRTVDLWQAERSGITSAERQILHLPVEQRGQLIAKRLESMTPDEQGKLLIDYTKKRIITRGVLEVIGETMSKPKPAK